MNNMNRTLTIAIAGFASSLIGIGCAKSGAANSTVTAALSMTGSSQPTAIASYKKAHPLWQLFSPVAVAFAPPAMVDGSSPARNVMLTKAWIIVKEVEFKLAETAGAEEAASSEIKFRGPFFVDLLSSIPVSFGAAEVPVGVYRRVKMKLEKDSALPAGAPTQLAGNSIYFEGTVSGSQFSYAAADGTEFKIAGAGGVNLNETANLVLGVKVSDLFKLIKMDAVAAAVNKNISDTNRITATNACPAIDPSANDIATCFRKGLEKAGKFGKDSDNNGEIEVGEDEVHD
ncbi:MAG: hypothetical protein H7061_08835 [Bdellovibrionaceae bacterium]|nr:hypothetical protein [Bdellovibrio sp.]